MILMMMNLIMKIDYLKEEATYEAQIQAKNNFGWSQVSDKFEFYTGFVGEFLQKVHYFVSMTNNYFSGHFREPVCREPGEGDCQGSVQIFFWSPQCLAVGSPGSASIHCHPKLTPHRKRKCPQ